MQSESLSLNSKVWWIRTHTPGPVLGVAQMHYSKGLSGFGSFLLYSTFHFTNILDIKLKEVYDVNHISLFYPNKVNVF